MNKKLKKLLKFFGVLILIAGFGAIFYHINDLNYNKIRQIRFNRVNHPEYLPTSNFAKITAFGFKNIKADIYWMETIQYIGGNAVSSAYKKYLYPITDLITELNPYFAHPYKIAMLLLPEYNYRYEKLDDKQKMKYIKKAEKIGLKAIKNFCDLKKIELIKKEDNLLRIWQEDKYKNPCKDYIMPYYLAYIYYFYLNDPKVAADYYKITSANRDAVEGAKILAAIMRGKGGDREKSFLMFVNMGKSLDNSKNKVCSKFGDLLQNKIAYQVFRQNNLDANLIKFVNTSRAKLFGERLTENDKRDLDKECENYMNKATRELNLYYIEQANKKYKKDNSKSAKNAKILYDKGYLKYLPKDYQQYDDYGIIYKYNDKTRHFDYEMGNYED